MDIRREGVVASFVKIFLGENSESIQFKLFSEPLSLNQSDSIRAFCLVEKIFRPNDSSAQSTTAFLYKSPVSSVYEYNKVATTIDKDLKCPFPLKNKYYFELYIYIREAPRALSSRHGHKIEVNTF